MRPTEGAGNIAQLLNSMLCRSTSGKLAYCESESQKKGTLPHVREMSVEDFLVPGILRLSPFVASLAA